jgi:hypothetical protein
MFSLDIICISAALAPERSGSIFIGYRDYRLLMGLFYLIRYDANRLIL